MHHPHLRRWALPALALALGVAAAPAPPPEAERLVPGGRAGFVTDGAGGCWVWAGGLAAGSEDITARWSGACPEGPAEGEGRSEIRWRDAGRDRAMIFEGVLRRGKAEGRGRLTHLEDAQVAALEEGDYADDRLVQGRLEIPRAGLVYEGGWRFSQPHGPGRLTLGTEVFEGEWEGGCLRQKTGWIAFTRPARDCEGRAT